jgi:hypothetical protein
MEEEKIIDFIIGHVEGKLIELALFNFYKMFGIIVDIVELLDIMYDVKFHIEGITKNG